MKDATRYVGELKKAKSVREVVQYLLAKGVEEAKVFNVVWALNEKLPLLKAIPSLETEVTRAIATLRTTVGKGKMPLPAWAREKAEKGAKKTAKPLAKAKPKPRAPMPRTSRVVAPARGGSKIDQIRAQREAHAIERERARKK